MPNDITAPKVKETCNPCIECNKITFEDLKKHNDPSNPWIGIKGYVYDVTKFLKDHPGGPDILIENAGTDASAVFEDVGHSVDAKNLLKKYKIGKLAKEKEAKK